MAGLSKWSLKSLDNVFGDQEGEGGVSSLRKPH